MRDQARRESTLILSEAHAEARSIQRHAIAENERLGRESRRLRAQLEEALSTLGDESAVSEKQTPPGSDETEERSWYGVPDANAA
jgi:hypothetical protein